MTITISWLINDRVLFITPSSLPLDSKELQDLIHQIKQVIGVPSSETALYFIHDLRKVDDRKQVILYVNSLYALLIPISYQVLVLSDKYWALEKRLMQRTLKNYSQQAVVHSLDESFQYLQQLDPSLPSLRAAFRARVRTLLDHRLESLSD